MTEPIRITRQGNEVFVAAGSGSDTHAICVLPKQARVRASYLTHLADRAGAEGQASVCPAKSGLPGPLMLLADAYAYALNVFALACRIDMDSETDPWPDLTLTTDESAVSV